MAQAIAETVFDVLYLCFALTAGLTMLVKGDQPLVKKAGLMGTELSKGMDASISGIAGIGHILMGVSLLMILWKIKRQAG